MRKTNSINYRNEAELVAHCPLAAAMKMLGGRWKLMILWYVAHGQHRYGRLRGIMPHISGKMLHQQLRELEDDGLLTRTRHGSAVEYGLTPLARDLEPALAALAAWSQRHDVASHLAARGDADVERAASAVPVTTPGRSSTRRAADR